jgi:hypothetical protein
LPDILDDTKQLRAFLIEQKGRLLEAEKRAKGTAKAAIVGQIQAFETLLFYFSKKQEERDMEELKLSLEEQAKPLSELKGPQEDNGLTKAIVELAQKLKPGTYLPLNGPAVKGRSVQSKIWALRKKGVLPQEVVPMQRGKEIYLAKKKG